MDMHMFMPDQLSMYRLDAITASLQVAVKECQKRRFRCLKCRMRCGQSKGSKSGCVYELPVLHCLQLCKSGLGHGGPRPHPTEYMSLLPQHLQSSAAQSGHQSKCPLTVANHSHKCTCLQAPSHKTHAGVYAG